MTDRPAVGWIAAVVRSLAMVALTLASVDAIHAQALGGTASTASAALGRQGHTWSELTAGQRQVLQPLAGLWPTMDGTNKERWLNVAHRFGSLSPQEQQRMQDRMTQWSRLPAQERGEARLRFQQSRQLSADERQKKWASYQALSPQERGELAQQARRKQQPVLLSDNMAGPREQGQPMARRPRDGDAMGKSNWVPGASPNAPAQMAVAPSLVKAGRGATTTLVNQRPMPPLHQQTGLTKIAASRGFVDPVTLLPKKGAQGAAMVGVPAASSPR